MKEFFAKNWKLVFYIAASAICVLNIVVHLTYGSIRYVNFNYLLFFKFLFEPYVGHYLRIPNEHILFLIYSILNVGFIYLLMNLIKSRLFVFGIITAIVYVLAQIPIYYDPTKIHI